MDYKTLFSAIEHVIREAGAIGLDYFNKDMHIEKKGVEKGMKHENSPVTQADITIESFLKEQLTTLIPGSGFLGEESDELVTDSSYKRIIDPIDGTREFSRTLPDWSILLGLQYEGEIVIGISYMPVIDELLYAIKGMGAWINDNRLMVSSRGYTDAYICHERHKYFVRDGNYDKFLTVCEQVDYYKSDRTRSFHYLAQGKIEAILSPKQYIFDFAPFILIITEAGGKVTTLENTPITQDYSTVLFSNGVCHDEILAVFNHE